MMERARANALLDRITGTQQAESDYADGYDDGWRDHGDEHGCQSAPMDACGGRP